MFLSVGRVRVYSSEWLEKGVGERQRESLLKFSPLRSTKSPI